MSKTRTGGFPSPFEVATPPGAEGWERMYPYYAVFSEDRRKEEEQRFWFFDSMHYPEPTYPFDLIFPEHTWVAASQNISRVFSVPTALGLDHRVVNGYVYVSPSVVTDPKEIQSRAAVFGERAGYYFEHWNEIYAAWVEKAKACIAELKQISFEPLPELEPIEVVHENRHLTSGVSLYRAYNRLLENQQEMHYLHFEMLGLGYGAYLALLDFCKKAFPSIDDQSVAKMVMGIDVLLFRPNDELRKLSHLAVELGLAGAFAEEATPEEVLEVIGAAANGERWLKEFNTVRDQWFWFSTGHGVSHNHPSWMEDLSIPFSAMRTYVESLQRGEKIDRPLDDVRAERDRVTKEYRELLSSDSERATFDSLINLTRTVYVFVEDHAFYCEHGHFSIFWTKVRQLGEVFAHHGFLESAEDIFLLQRFEIYPALWDLETGWGAVSQDRRAYWHREVAERKRILEALRGWSPPPALGALPEVITEPFTVMLWGITTETLERWLARGEESENVLQGVAASPGTVEGLARVIHGPDELTTVKDGEVLVCPITNPSWTPIFKRIKAAVSDSGGIMAHAAIVSREYGLPAVVGTGFGTQVIKTGQLVRVDGTHGVVTVLDDEPAGADGDSGEEENTPLAEHAGTSAPGVK
jgi:pyruvate,water dikinase